MSHAHLARGDGSTVVIGALVGRGGEGEVRDVIGHPELVAKIYNQSPTRERIAKLEAMVTLADADLARIAAWPSDVLRDRPGGRVVGFLMPKVGDRLELHKLSHPMDRFQHFPDVGYDFLVLVATNVARAFEALHKKGLVVGDVNESGVMVGRDGGVMLIDTDSMQFEARGVRYTCDVGKPEFQPPELLVKGSFRGLVRGVEHDAFGMAVLVFQLLFFGWHPFNVRMLIGDQEPVSDNIIEHRYPYARAFRQRDFVRPPHAQDPAVMPDYVRELLDRSFGRGQARPSASEWVAGLTRLSAESRTCERFGTHAYHEALPRCPICDLDGRLGFPILPHIALDAAQLRKLWSTIQAAYYELVSPLSGEAEDVAAEAAPRAEVPPEVTAHAKKTVGATWAQIGLGVAAAGLALVDPVLAALGAGIAPLEVWHRVTRPIATRRALAEQARLERDRARARRALGAPNDSAVSQNFELAADAYARIIRFDDRRQKARADLYDRAFPAQMRRFLSEVPLQAGIIPGIDRKRVATLVAHGVRTAADVTAELPTMPGITAQHVAILHRWVEFNQSRFMPDLKDPALVRQVAQIDKALDMEHAQLVERLKLSSEWLVERLPIERERRRRALEHYAATARALAEHERLGRVARARWRVPRVGETPG
ncbi:MAG: hypothetical protein IT385_06620 [Deltaproteobacteria bacterium]|nr:hypothetical protein [Deltaproteobacteria bacterium]